MLRGTGITPNMITVISIFVGAAVGFMFYHDNLTYNICGILLLVFANILDCVDGQLARLTGSSPLSGVSWTDSPGISGSLRSISDSLFVCLMITVRIGSLPWRSYPVCLI